MADELTITNADPYVFNGINNSGNVFSFRPFLTKDRKIGFALRYNDTIGIVPPPTIKNNEVVFNVQDCPSLNNVIAPKVSLFVGEDAIKKLNKQLKDMEIMSKKKGDPGIDTIWYQNNNKKGWHLDKLTEKILNDQYGLSPEDIQKIQKYAERANLFTDTMTIKPGGGLTLNNNLHIDKDLINNAMEYYNNKEDATEENFRRNEPEAEERVFRRTSPSPSPFGAIQDGIRSIFGIRR